jgi:pilus assembly protein CpaE
MTDAMVQAKAPIDSEAGISVVDSDELVRTVLIDQLGALRGGVTAFETVAAFREMADPSRPVVVVFGPSERPEEILSSVETLGTFGPDFGAVMIVHRLNAQVLQRALRAGIDDVVSASADDDELLDAIARVSDRVSARVSARVLPEQTVPSAGPVASAPSHGRVITVFGTKGGAGKSVVATNLAVALARRTIQPVVLVDADLQFGDVALMLQLEPVHTIDEAVHAGDRLDGSLLESLLLRDPASGLFVLAAPTESRSADGIGRDDLVRILEVLRERCAYVVVDTSANFAEITLAALEAADDILVLASLDILSLKSARVGLQTMGVLGFPASRVKLVLNRANTRVGLTEADAERALQLKIDTALPSDILVATSVNRGVPMVTSAPRSKFARSVDDLASRLMVSVPAGEQPHES